MPKVTFNNKHAQFYTSLKADVDEYFKTKGISSKGNIHLYVKAMVLLPAAVIIYYLLLFTNIPVFLSLLLSGILGFLFACIGFNVMHDACHGSFSKKKWVNELFGYSINLLGGNAFIWKFKHNIIHHTYTNVDGIDDDIAKSPLMRQCHSQKWVPAHRFQHIYVIFVYAISSFAWVAIMDFNKYFKQKVFATPLQKMDVKEHLIFWFSKLLNIFLYIVLPILLLGLISWAIGFTVLHIFLGLTLAIVFQLAHVVEQTEFEFAGTNDLEIENEWAVHQVRTTANFSPRSKVISWFAGGLNYQIEHHLFPRISHVHYPALSKIVEQKCKEFGLSYNTNETMWKAISSHFRMMKLLGQQPNSNYSAGLVA
jgi:linoleoyl-CoA desaturase